MNTKNFMYKFTSNGFMRKENTKKTYIELICLFVVAIVLFIITYLARETLLLFLFGFFGLFIMIFIIFFLIRINNTSKMVCSFDFNSNTMTFDKQKDIEEYNAGLNTVDISEFDSIIYSSRLIPRRYESSDSAQLRAMEKYPLAVVNNNEVINVKPWNTLNLTADRLIISTTKMANLYSNVGFHLYNEKTDKLIFLMDANVDKLEETYEYIIKTVKPKKLFSMEVENNQFKFKETILNN